VSMRPSNRWRGAPKARSGEIGVGEVLGIEPLFYQVKGAG